MVFPMRIVFVLIFVVLAVVGGLWGSGQLSAVLPPEISLKQGDESIDDSFTLSDEAMHLIVVSEPGGFTSEATLFLFGAPIETLALDRPEVAFKPTLLSPGNNEVRVRVRRNVGPIKLVRWHRFSVYATPNGSALEMELNTPKSVWSSEVPLEGKALPGSRVSLRVRELVWDAKLQTTRVAREITDTIRSNSVGIFAHTMDLPHPGRYEVTAQTEIWSEEDQTSNTYVSETRKVVFETQLPLLKERALIVLLDTDGLRYQTRAVFERGDPRGEAVLRGELSGRAFQEAIHGRILVNNATYGEQWTGPVTSFAEEDRIEVRQETGGIPVRVFSEGLIRISSWKDGVPEARQERIEIRFKERRAEGFSPSPATVNEERAIWNSTTGTLPELVTLQIDTLEATRSAWSMSPKDILPNWVEHLFFTTVSLLPLIWFLHVLARPSELDRTEKRLRQTLIVLGAFIAFGAMSYLSRLLGDELVSYLLRPMNVEPHQLQDVTGGLRHSEIGVIVGFVAMLLFLLLGRSVVPKTGWWEAFRDLLLIALKALMWALLYNLTSAFVGRLWHLEGAIDQIVTVLLWWVVFILCATIGAQLITKLIDTGQAVSEQEFSRPVWLTGTLALALIVLARPGELGYDPLVERLTSPAYDAVFTIRRFMGIVGSIAPLLAAFLMCAFLARDTPRLTDARRTAIATLLFAGVLVGMGRVWTLFPIPFLLALVIFPAVVLQSEKRAALLKLHRADILNNKHRFLTRELSHAKQYMSSNGWFGFGLFGVRQEDQKKKGGYAPLKATFPDGTKIALPELGLAFGRNGVALENALASLKVGAWGALFFVIIYAVPSFAETRSGDSFPYLAAIQRVVSVGGYWLISAFFFGYFFDRIRGAAGWKKGAVLAIGLLLAREPIALLNATSLADYSAIAIQVVQTTVFFVLLGLITFDVHAFRETAAPNTNWSVFPLLTGLSVVEAFLSITVATLGIAASTAFSGELTSVLGQVAAEIIQTPTQSTPIVGQ